MKKRLPIILLIMGVLLTTCEERERTNPLDPETELDPSEWAPSNLQIQVIDDSQLKLTWTQEEERISGFKIGRKAGSGSFTQIAQVGKDVIQYTDTGLNYVMDYTYRVSAFTAENESGYATSTSTTTSFPSPTGLAGTPIDDQSIQLTWSDNCVFEDGYRLERSEDGVSFTQISELGENIIEYTDTGLNYGTGYTYRAKAFTDANESNYATSNTTNLSFPSPTNLTATAVDDQTIQLTWSDNCSFEDGYKLERSSGGSYSEIAEVDANVTGYTDTGLALGTDYTYRVSAFTALNESGHIELIVYFWQDCEGEWGGSAVEDCAGECNGSAEEDCAGECNGTTVEDCNGDCDGTAFENECDYCVGGNTGLVENNCGTVTDVDGNSYESIIIGNQVWMTENLKVTHFRNGDSLIAGLSIIFGLSAYTVYDNDETNADTYGYLYNWYAVTDSRNIAPEGWHVPTNDEWQILVDYLGGSSVAGGKLKEAGTTHWYSPNTGATNESGFTALPGGYGNKTGTFNYMGSIANFWSSTFWQIDDAYRRSLHFDDSDVAQSGLTRRHGISIRCVKD